eukprot:scaffold38210_cov191-Amphora_coffeaeformis.AAC.1
MESDLKAPLLAQSYGHYLRYDDLGWAHQSRYYSGDMSCLRTRKLTVEPPTSCTSEKNSLAFSIQNSSDETYFFVANQTLASPPRNTTMSNRRIAALTNLGVKSIHSGRYNSAILTLKHAVRCLASITLQNKHLDESDTDCMGASESSIPLARMPLQDVDEAGFREISAHNTFTVFTSTFTYETALDPVEFFSEIAMGLYFNLGLAHHLAGLSNGSESQEHLQYALMNYKRSMGLFQSTEGSRLECWVSFLLGLLNNIGYIFRHFSETTKALECIAYMELVISSPVAVDLTEDDEIAFSA